MEHHPDSGTGTTLLVLLRDPTNPQVWEAFVNRYAPRIVRWCLAFGAQPADAEDVCQEILYKLARQIRVYDKARGSFRAWLKTLTRNAWADIRDHRRPSDALPADYEDPSPPLEEVLDQEFMREVFEEAKRRVQASASPTTWRAFELLAVKGWSGAQVAAELHVGIGAVYAANARVKARLAEEVRRLEEPDLHFQESQP